ncbi:aldose epimerase family protein [Streptomyces millisiae]|uniref:Aldose 1-epimerase n=1 Tax=Streptomyces millisiae TaxID=3075542 RepID=A0ABU2LTF0_9ACTN|nr:aldose 1-epimerase [Streptomyces sp. DSM 44918]MDT0320457.1 aldose 1-epimerase [Streptomyces sp. DSM 44918]
MTTDDTDSGVRLRAADTELTVRPDEGGRLSSLRVGGLELLRQGERFGSFVMAPWCGRTREGRFSNGTTTHQLPVNAGPHAIHGTVRNRPWRLVSADDRSAALVCDLGGGSDAWPYRGRVSQLVELAEDGSGLTLTLGVETLGDSFPAQAGWHPWFLRTLSPEGKDVTIDFTAEWQEERGDDHLPTGHRVPPGPGPWDDCFGMPDGVRVALVWPDELELTVASRTPWVVVYDEQPEAVCVEPQSGPPNGLNTHPRLVTELEPLEISTSWTWRRL